MMEATLQRTPPPAAVHPTPPELLAQAQRLADDAAAAGWKVRRFWSSRRGAAAYALLHHPQAGRLVVRFADAQPTREQVKAPEAKQGERAGGRRGAALRRESACRENPGSAQACAVKNRGGARGGGWKS